MFVRHICVQEGGGGGGRDKIVIIFFSSWVDHSSPLESKR